jgi:hypothetical protein
VQGFVDYCTDYFFGVFKLFLDNTIQLIDSLNKNNLTLKDLVIKISNIMGGVGVVIIW